MEFVQRNDGMRLLFHGSGARFTEFDPAYAKTGEGVGGFEGWYLVKHLKGAYYHVRNYLRLSKSPGAVYVCLVPDEFAIDDCEGGYTDSIYQGQAVGVHYRDSRRIEIVDVLDIEHLDDEVLGPLQSYCLADTRAPLQGGLLSYLRRN